MLKLSFAIFVLLTSSVSAFAYCPDFTGKYTNNVGTIKKDIAVEQNSNGIVLTDSDYGRLVINEKVQNFPGSNELTYIGYCRSLRDKPSEYLIQLYKRGKEVGAIRYIDFISGFHFYAEGLYESDIFFIYVGALH